MTECEALERILDASPGLSLGADGLDVFVELINVINLAYLYAKSLGCWNALFPIMFAQAQPIECGTQNFKQCLI